MKLPIELYEQILWYIPAGIVIQLFGCSNLPGHNPWNIAVRDDCMDALNWLHRTREPIPTDLFEYTCEVGNLNLVKWVFTRYPSSICLGCHASYPQWICNHGSDTREFKIFERVFEKRKFESIKYLLDVGYVKIEWVNEKIREAISGGKLGILESLYSIGSMDIKNSSIEIAVRNQKLAVAQWLHHHKGHQLDKNLLDIALEYSNLEVIKWIYETGDHEFTLNNLNRAIITGQDRVFGYVFMNCDQGNIMDMIKLGQQCQSHNVLKWLREYYEKLPVSKENQKVLNAFLKRQK